MFTRLVWNDRNNAMENWRKGDLMNTRSSFTHFFPPRLITAHIINSMLLSIDRGCRTWRRRPLPHRDTQARSIFRLLQRCRSEVGGLKKAPAKTPPSGSTSLFKRHVAALRRAPTQLFFRSTCSWQSWDLKGFGKSLTWTTCSLTETSAADCLVNTTLPPCGLEVCRVAAARPQGQSHTFRTDWRERNNRRDGEKKWT